MIGIINYGLGNINAFYEIYKENGIKLKIIDNYKDLKNNYNKIILPGVGSFDKAITLLKSKLFFDEILNFSINKNNKILGICVGMQILASTSDEGELSGFSFIDNNFNKLKSKVIPHIGWNNVSVKKHLADAEDLRLKPEQKFDIIYAGNLLHHVDVEKMILNAKPHLEKGGVFVSWDPLAYNPLINIYRYIATDVRTPDEHPLKIRDLKLFDKNFYKVEKKYFWFFTLIIFVIMAVFQKRNPNKERFWKVILDEGDKWKWLYKPLEKLDKFFLAIFPPLRLLCWNVVIFAYKK